MAALRGTSGLGLLLSCIILVAFAFLWYFFSFSKGVNPCIVLCPLFPSCSLTGVCLKDIKTHSNALPPNTQNFPVQNHLMANPAPQMPLRGTQNAPKFDGKAPAPLPHFLKDVDILGTVLQFVSSTMVPFSFPSYVVLIYSLVCSHMIGYIL